MTDELEVGAEPTNWRDQFGFMTPDHPHAFMDLLEQGNPYKNTPAQKCLKCHGYGRWILALHEYPQAVGYNQHFIRECDNCNGVGWTRPENHIHKWVFDKNIGKSYDQYRCVLCPKIWKVDSGD